MITIIISLFRFVETSRKFIIAELSIRKLGSGFISANNSTDEDLSLLVINLRGVSTNQYKYILNFLVGLGCQQPCLVPYLYILPSHKVATDPSYSVWLVFD